MARVTIKEAVAISPVSLSTLRRDIKSGKVSSEKDDRGRRRIDTAELARVYGQLRHSREPTDTQMTAVDTPNGSPVDVNDTPDTLDDNPKVVALMENQIGDLKTQLERASERETALRENLKTAQSHLTAEQEKTRLLMLPASEAHTAPERKPNWVQRLLGIQTS